MPDSHLLNARLFHREGNMDKGRAVIRKHFKPDFLPTKTDTLNIILTHAETKCKLHWEVMSKVAYTSFRGLQIHHFTLGMIEVLPFPPDSRTRCTTFSRVLSGRSDRNPEIAVQDIDGIAWVLLPGKSVTPHLQ